MILDYSHGNLYSGARPNATVSPRMNIRIFSAVVSVALIAASGEALAEGIYVGVGIGSMQIEDARSGYSINDFPFGTRLFVGVEASKKLAFEAAFIATDTANQGSGRPETRGDFSGVAIFATSLVPPGDKGGLIARLGLFRGKLEIDSVSPTIDTRKYGFALGVGYVFNLNEQFSIRGDFDTFLSEFDKLSNATIGIQVSFR